ncbi:MAG: Gfo/Idh/MocA family oxidoreductase [Bacteroidota bacterium]
MKPIKERLEDYGQSIRVGIVGIGSIGRGLAHQVHHTPGFELTGLADIDTERAIQCAKYLGLDYAIVNSYAQMKKARRRKKVAITTHGMLIAQNDENDVFIESSNAIVAGAKFALKAIQTGTHVVMMNYEAELMYGPYLLHQARQHGVVYTCADGDQPTVIKKLVDDLTFWGFDLVMAGNIKGYLDRYTNPTKIKLEADKRNLDHKMCSAYTDGSKLNVEMAVLANGLNLMTHRTGMQGPQAKSIYDVFKHFDFPSIYQDRQPVVDYILGAVPKGGVFAIGYTEDKFQQYTLGWYPPEMGPGPFYLFYRPYHLGHIEALNGVVEAVLDQSSRLQPKFGMKTNVFTYAKKNLKAGEILDGLGGYTCYGLIENLSNTIPHDGLPICLSDGVRLKYAKPKDSRITLDDIEIPRQQETAFEWYDQACGIGIQTKSVKIF